MSIIRDAPTTARRHLVLKFSLYCTLGVGRDVCDRESLQCIYKSQSAPVAKPAGRWGAEVGGTVYPAQLLFTAVSDVCNECVVNAERQIN